MEEKGHVLHVLKETKKALERKDYVKVKHLSNKIIHNASITQDTDVVYVAVILYSLSKLIERENYKSYSNWQDFYRNYVKGIDNAIKALERKDLEGFHKEIDFITHLISELSGNLRHYIKDVFTKAKINKASKIYEHGISMETTAKILGISVWELAEYTGQAKTTDVNLTVTMPIKDRIKNAEEIFR